MLREIRGSPATTPTGRNAGPPRTKGAPPQPGLTPRHPRPTPPPPMSPPRNPRAQAPKPKKPTRHAYTLTSPLPSPPGRNSPSPHGTGNKHGGNAGTEEGQTGSPRKRRGSHERKNSVPSVSPAAKSHSQRAGARVEKEERGRRREETRKREKRSGQQS